LQQLYNLGARKFAISGVGPLGCIPSQLASNNAVNGQCIDTINGYVRGFNTALKSLLTSLTAQLIGSTFLYANTYDLVIDRVNNPAQYGKNPRTSISVLYTLLIASGMELELTPWFCIFIMWDRCFLQLLRSNTLW
jgi:hypothetical protein